jgi:hypothetical protein
MEIGEALPAITTLEEEPATPGNLGEIRFKCARLAGEDQRRIVRKRLFRLGERRGIEIFWQVPRFVGLPASRVPFLFHGAALVASGRARKAA